MLVILIMVNVMKKIIISILIVLLIGVSTIMGTYAVIINVVSEDGVDKIVNTIHIKDLLSDDNGNYNSTYYDVKRELDVNDEEMTILMNSSYLNESLRIVLENVVNYKLRDGSKLSNDKIYDMIVNDVNNDNTINYVLKNKVINKILPRKNVLIRPPVANIDQALILTSTIEPSFSSNLLDKMLVIIEYNNIKPIICFTKYDLLEDKTYIDSVIEYYKKIGYDVFINDEIDNIKNILNKKVSVLTGQTGVGKSSLLNRLKENLNLKTGEISKALGRGRHTTRHVELLKIEDGLVADTPGFSSLDFIGMNKNDITL